MSHVYCAGMNHIYICLAAAPVYMGDHFRCWARHLFGSALCRKLRSRGVGRSAFCFALFPVWFKSQATPVLISSNEFTNQYCQQKNHQPCKQAELLNTFTASCLLLSGERTNSTRRCRISNLPRRSRWWDRAAHNGWASLPIKSIVFFYLLYSF